MTGVTTGPRQRWLGPASVAVFLGMPLVLAVLTLGHLGSWWDAHSGRAENEERIAELETRIRRLAMEQAGKAGKPDAGQASIYLAATAPGLARAELQQRIVALIEQAGGRLIEARGEDEPEAAASVLLRATLDIGNAGLFDLLAAIETGVPLLTVEGLNIRTQTGRGGAEAADPVLRVALAVRGHRKEARP